MTTRFHTQLSNYFSTKPLYLDAPTQKKPNTRKLMEQPWQQTKGELWEDVTNTLCNLDFIQAKAVAKMTFELVMDFNSALEVIPDNANTIWEEKEREDRMEKNMHDLIACAKGEIQMKELEIPKSIKPWTKFQTETEIERIKTNPTKADLLKDFLNFVGNESDNLQNYASEYACFAHQQAWNYAAEGPVGKAAGELEPELGKYLLRRNPFTRPPWNPKPQALQTLKGHTSSVTAVAITADGKRAISGSWITCILWDLQSGEPLQILKGHTSSVDAVAITADGKRAISGSKDKTSILWDLQTGEALQTLKGHTSDVSAVAITANGKWAISGSWDKTCILWDLQSGEDIRTLKGHTSLVTSIAITTDGKRAISGSHDNTCILWDLHSGEVLQTLKGHTHSVLAVAITYDGKRAISGSWDGTCKLWDLQSGEALQTLKGHTDFISTVDITADGKHAISGSEDRTCKLWDLHSGESLKTLKGHTDQVTAAATTADGKWAISSSWDKTCILWDLKSGEALHTLVEHTSQVEAVDIFTGAKRVIFGSKDMSGNKLITVQHGEKPTLKGHTWRVMAVANADGKRAVSGSYDMTCMLWDLQSGEALKILKGHTSYVSSVAITIDGKHAISGSWDKTCLLWDLQSGEAIKTLKVHTDFIMAVAITADGKRAISGSQDKTCILWDLQSGEALQTLKGHTCPVSAVAFTPDGKRAISGSGDKTCILWDLQNGKALKTLKGHTNGVIAVAITADGKQAISGSYDKTCILWDLQSGKALQTLKGHTDWVNAVAITADRKRAISGSQDNTCILWDLQSGEALARYVTNSEICSGALYPAGILLGCASGELVFLLTNKELLHSGIAITTIDKIWDFEFRRYQEFSSDCPFCGHRFAPPQVVIKTIIQILKDSRIKSNQSPCLELPDEAWEHPGLIGECPECHVKLKFNPFLGSDMKQILEENASQEREIKYLATFEAAEKLFKTENWNEAYNQYLKLVQQGKFDINYMRFNMAVCKLNLLNTNNPEIINEIQLLIKLLLNKGETKKAKIIEDQLNAKLDVFKQEELLKKEAEKPWWKKLF